jgi:magnesium transporter
MDSTGSVANAPPPEIAASVVYVDGRRERDVPVESLAAYVNRPDSLLWVGLREPSPETLVRVLSQLGAGADCCEEMLEAHRRPKILEYGNMVLVIAITVEIEVERAVFGELRLLIGENFLLTVRHGKASSSGDVRARLEAMPDLLKRGGDFVASELLDLMADRYAAALGKLEQAVEGAEQKLLIRGIKDADIRKVYRQRRDLLRIHMAVAPMVEICRRLARVDVPVIDRQARPYFGEVADRVQRIDEIANSLRESLAFAFEASQMIVQTQQNEITRKLAAWAAILAVPTAVAGIYGMNFDVMPELRWVWGYPTVVGGMAAVCGVLYWRFRKAKWL